jgi:hypothetical protein
VMDRVVSSLLAELDGAGGVNFNFGGNRAGADQVAEMYVSGLSQSGDTLFAHTHQKGALPLPTQD